MTVANDCTGTPCNVKGQGLAFTSQDEGEDQMNLALQIRKLPMCYFWHVLLLLCFFGGVGRTGAAVASTIGAGGGWICSRLAGVACAFGSPPACKDYCDIIAGCGAAAACGCLEAGPLGCAGGVAACLADAGIQCVANTSDCIANAYNSCKVAYEKLYPPKDCNDPGGAGVNPCRDATCKQCVPNVFNNQCVTSVPKSPAQVDSECKTKCAFNKDPQNDPKNTCFDTCVYQCKQNTPSNPNCRPLYKCPNGVNEDCQSQPGPQGQTCEVSPGAE